MLQKARALEFFKGLKGGEVERAVEVTHLSFANDALLFCEPDIEALPGNFWTQY